VMFRGFGRAFRDRRERNPRNDFRDPGASSMPP
jgi:hypothetical protein